MQASNYKIINFEYLKQNFGEDTSFWKEIVGEAHSNISELKTAYAAASQANEWKQVGELAHQLKGVVEVFGLQEFARELKLVQIDCIALSKLETMPNRVHDGVLQCDKMLTELQLAFDEL